MFARTAEDSVDHGDVLCRVEQRSKLCEKSSEPHSFARKGMDYHRGCIRLEASSLNYGGGGAVKQLVMNKNPVRAKFCMSDGLSR